MSLDGVVVPKKWWEVLPRKVYASLEKVETSQPWFDVYKLHNWLYAVYEGGQFDEPLMYVVIGDERDVYAPDEAGWFKVQVDRGAGKIVALHYPPGKEKPSTIVKGGDARIVYQTVVRLGLVTRLDHAAYLGKELAKASIALRLWRSYQQDVDIF